MAEICLDPICLASQAASEMGESAAQNAIETLQRAVMDAVAKAMTSMGTFWVKGDTANLTGSGFTADGALKPSETVAFIQGSLWWYTAAFAILATIIGGARMAWERRAEPGRDLLKSMLTMIVVSGAGLTFIWHAMRAADGFSEWIIDRSLTGTDFAANILGLLALNTAANVAVGPLLAIIVGLIVVFVAIAQTMLMVARTGMLVVLAGVLPCLASFTSTERGRDSFTKACCWTVALILYKPAAAIVYATAFKLTGSKVFGNEGDGLLAVLVGLMLMLLALFALPALMRLITPAVGAVSSGGGGGAVGGALASAIPMGAAAVGGRRGGGNNAASQSGPPPGANPSGAGNAVPPAPAPVSPSPPTPASNADAPSSGGGANVGASSTAGGAGAGAAAGAVPVGAVVQGVATGAQKGRDAVVSTAEQAASNSAQPEEGPRGSK